MEVGLQEHNKRGKEESALVGQSKERLGVADQHRSDCFQFIKNNTFAGWAKWCKINPNSKSCKEA